MKAKRGASAQTSDTLNQLVRARDDRPVTESAPLKRVGKAIVGSEERMDACGMPDVITSWVAALGVSEKGARFRERAARFAAYGRAKFDNAEKLKRAWGLIAKHGRSQDRSDDPAQLAVFLRLPDRAEYNPHALVWGGRYLDPDVVVRERKRYAEALDALKVVQRLLGPPYDDFRALLFDASASDLLNAVSNFRRDHERPMRLGLAAFREVLESIDPVRKVPAEHWTDEAKAAHRNYVLALADLNRHLAKPQHAAIATLARVNCPSVHVKVDDIRKAWSLSRKNVPQK